MKLWCAINPEPDLKLRDKLKHLVVYTPIGTKCEELCNNVRRVWFAPLNTDFDLKCLSYINLFQLI